MAMTEKQKTAHWQDFVVWYENKVGSQNPIPKELKKLYMANDGAWDKERALKWIRLNDDNYLATDLAQGRMAKFRELFESAYGFSFNWKSKANKKQLEAFARANPEKDINVRLSQIFEHRIMTSDAFKKSDPAFKQWLKKTVNSGAWVGGDIISALGAYRTDKADLQDFWNTKLTGTMPTELMTKALANGWKTDNVEFLSALYNTEEWRSSQGFADRTQVFDQQWDQVFSGMDVPVDEEMRDEYVRNPTMQFEEFFHMKLKLSDTFKDAFPDYTEWEANSEQPEGSVDIWSYFEKRADLMDIWNREFTDGREIDPDLISQAMRGNWSDTVFLNKLRTLPAYADSGTGKDKVQKFTKYWKEIFGDVSVPDAALTAKFLNMDTTEPSALWDDIKATGQFQSTFKYYDSFATAQTDAGMTINQDPAMYNAYKAQFKQAFADIGQDVPTELEGEIFASGQTANKVEENVATYGKTKESYQRFTGQTADLKEGLGLKDQAAGGDLRKRWNDALEAHKAFINGQVKAPDTTKDSTTGYVTQSI